MRKWISIIVSYCLLLSACGKHTLTGLTTSTSPDFEQSTVVEKLAETTEEVIVESQTDPKVTSGKEYILASSKVSESTIAEETTEEENEETADEIETSTIENDIEKNIEPEQLTDTISFDSLDDPDLVQYIQDAVYANLEDHYLSDDYRIDDVSAVYVSKEYIEELEYNSKTNIFFGYSLEDIEKQFGDTKYVFTLSEDGNTTVKAFDPYHDDTFDTVIKDVAIGSGVILTCVTISAISKVLGASTIRYIFTTSAKKGAELASIAGIISGASAGIIEGLETHDFESALKETYKGAAKGIKCGAISGVVVGLKTSIVEVTRPIPTAREAELQVLKEYPGEEQVSFYNHEVVPSNTQYATKPDIITVNPDGTSTAIEVKDYDLEHNLYYLKKVLRKQIADRVIHLPEDFTQMIVLNVRGRNYSKEFVNQIIDELQTTLADIYPSIPIVPYGLVL